jgi:hypothetical protein
MDVTNSNFLVLLARNRTWSQIPMVRFDTGEFSSD